MRGKASNDGACRVAVAGSGPPGSGAEFNPLGRLGSISWIERRIVPYQPALIAPSDRLAVLPSGPPGPPCARAAGGCGPGVPGI